MPYPFEGLAFQQVVNSASDLTGDLRSDTLYLVDGAVDVSAINIVVPVGGLSIQGLTFDTSSLVSTSNSHQIFTSPVGGSGNLLIRGLSLTASGTGSSAFALTDNNGNSAVEFTRVNFNGCSSLGYLDGYRQLLEDNTGRFGGSPELEFRNSWNGARITTSIVRGISGITSLFKTGAGLNFSGRFITDINCDLPATGALFDFSDSNITNDESLIVKGAFVTRAGVIDAADSTITPNINNTSVKSLWSDNTGLPNTKKYIRASVTTEVETTISATDTYYPLLGTFTVDKNSHFDMPANGQFRLLSGNGSYQFSGDLTIDGSANNVIDIRVTKSTDGGSTFPTEIFHVSRQINSLVGSRDVAFFPLNFIDNLVDSDIVRLEIENKTSTSNVTVELDSYFIVTAT